jgi:hypothetical protein
MRVHRRQDVLDTPAYDPAVTDDRIVSRRTAVRVWSPAQFVSLAIGIGFVVLGIAALARTGSSDWYTPVRTIWHLGHTPLLGWIDIAFGALAILAGVVPGGLRWLMGLLGAAALAFGIVVLVDAAPYRMHRYFGVNDTYAWLAVAVGAVMLLAAFLAPVFVSGGVDVRRNVVTDPPR